MNANKTKATKTKYRAYKDKFIISTLAIVILISAFSTAYIDLYNKYLNEKYKKLECQNKILETSEQEVSRISKYLKKYKDDMDNTNQAINANTINKYVTN